MLVYRPNDPQVALALRAGQVGILPADTVYGLMCVATNARAVAQLYALKRREHKPGTVIAASIAQLEDLGVASEQLQYVAHLWPNPLTIVLPVDSQLHYLTQDLDSLAVRVPSDPAVRALLQQTGPLLTSSANHAGHPPANTVAEAHAYFGEHVAFYVDGGDRSGQQSSTVVRPTANGRLEVLRQGTIHIDNHGGIAA